MKLYTGILAIAASFFSSAVAYPSSTSQSAPQPFSFFTNNTIYQTVGNDSISYPRYVELDDGTILATATLVGPDPMYFPIFESKDGGATWAHISDLHDTANGWGMSAQPALAVLKSPLGGYPAGTILGSGNCWGPNATRIDLYASRDQGRTWEFVSHIAEGKAPGSKSAIWEPYLMQYEDKLIAYYSDERDSAHSQKLSHQTSSDLKTWGPVVEDVAYDDASYRPGMTIVAYIPPTKKWILVHEMGTGTRIDGHAFPNYYVMADSPLEFASSKGQLITTQGGTKTMGSSPYVVWSPVGGENGTIVVADASLRSVFTNSFGGAADKWEGHMTPAGVTYSRALLILKDRPEHLMIFGAETFSHIRDTTHTPLTATVVNLTEVLTAPFSG